MVTPEMVSYLITAVIVILVVGVSLTIWIYWERCVNVKHFLKNIWEHFDDIIEELW